MNVIVGGKLRMGNCERGIVNGVFLKVALKEKVGNEEKRLGKLDDMLGV